MTANDFTASVTLRFGRSVIVVSRYKGEHPGNAIAPKVDFSRYIVKPSRPLFDSFFHRPSGNNLVTHDPYAPAAGSMKRAAARKYDEQVEPVAKKIRFGLIDLQ